MKNQRYELPEDFVVFGSQVCRYTRFCEESYDKFIWSLGWVWVDNVSLRSADQAFNGLDDIAFKR